MNKQETIAWHKGRINGLQTLRNELRFMKNHVEEWIKIEKDNLKELGVKE